ncbi:MAG: hypothetical protein F2667_07950 [Actinobacteria bacterium]|uniref:Unannotated protein n=1 Tax=freshwater metagenome TaxID=449393 RepID=A0A6J6QJQ7_9ZZZZ|nr:hypothetical protein [Actinomycetota bacterium]
MATGREILALLAEPEPEPEPASAPRSRRLAALARTVATRSAAASRRQAEDDAVSTPEAPAEPARPAPSAAATFVQQSEEAAAAPAPPPVAAPAPPRDVTFAPVTGLRRALGLVLLASLAVTAVVGYAAYDTRSDANIGLTAIFGVLSVVLWAVRASSSVARLHLQGSQLEILSAAGRHVFDLSNPYTSIEVVGAPGRRGWRVLFHRRNMSPYEVTSSMVDPAQFMETLRYFRPEL